MMNKMSNDFFYIPSSMFDSSLSSSQNVNFNNSLLCSSLQPLHIPVNYKEWLFICACKLAWIIHFWLLFLFVSFKELLLISPNENKLCQQWELGVGHFKICLKVGTGVPLEELSGIWETHSYIVCSLRPKKWPIHIYFA